MEGLGEEFTSNGYDVLVYYNNDNNANTAGFTAEDNAGNADTRYGHQITANNNWPRFDVSRPYWMRLDHRIEHVPVSRLDKYEVLNARTSRLIEESSATVPAG